MDPSLKKQTYKKVKQMLIPSINRRQERTSCWININTLVNSSRAVEMLVSSRGPEYKFGQFQLDILVIISALVTQTLCLLTRLMFP